MTNKGEYPAAVPFLQRAIQLDPNFAMAYASLGLAFSHSGAEILGMEDTQKADDSFLVTRLWDKRGIEWRDASKPDPTDKVKDTKIIEELKRISDAAKSSDPNARISIEETAFMQIKRSVARKKGKWDRFGPEVK